MRRNTREHHRRRHEAGVSTSEFLICAPIVSLLALVAFDLNKRAEDRQVVTILARNAVYLGEAAGADGLRAATKDGLERMGNIMDPRERRELTDTPASTDASGLHIALRTDAQLHDDTAMTNRLGSVAGVQTIAADGNPSTYNRIAGAEGTLAKHAAPLLSRAQRVASDVGLTVGDHVRVAEVTTRSTGKENGIQKAAVALERIALNAQEGQTVPYPERRHGHAAYGRLESGYHAADYRSSTFWGMGFGYVFRSRWGGSQSETHAGGAEGEAFGDKVEMLHRRCFTRLALNDACGGGIDTLLAALSGPAAAQLETLSRRLEKLSEKAQRLEKERQKAIEDGRWDDQIKLQEELKKVTKRVKNTTKEIERIAGSIGGSGEHDRKFLGKIRKIVAVKIAIDIILKIFAADAHSALEDPARRATDMLSERMASQLGANLDTAFTSILSSFKPPLDASPLDALHTPGLDLSQQLQTEAPVSLFQGTLHEP